MATGRISEGALENGSPLQKISELLDARLRELSIGWILLLVVAVPSLVLAILNTSREARIFGSISSLCSLAGCLYTYLKIKSIRQELERDRLSGGDAGRVPERDAIGELYVELRRLIARSADDPSLNPEVQSRLARLRALQGEEAEKIRRHLDEGLSLKPGTGYQALEKARRLLAEHAHPASEDLPSSR